MGKKAEPALRIVEAPPAPDRLTVASTELLLAINRALFDLKQMPDLPPGRAARAYILQHLLKNVRDRLMET